VARPERQKPVASESPLWPSKSGEKDLALSNDKLARNYEKPFSWWGLDNDAPNPLGLLRLIASNTLATGEAAFLTLAVEMRRSIIIAAAEDQAGKTTLLTALLEFLDPSTRPVYIRGIYERFEYLSELAPSERYVLCNEISAHLPTYLWGRGVRYLFEGLGAGFPMATTMHADSAADVLETLLKYPLEVPPEHVAGIDLIVLLRRGMVDGREVRRVVSVDRVTLRGGRPESQQISVRVPLRSAPQLFSGRMIAALARWGEISDEEASRLLAAQERFLAECVTNVAEDPDGFAKRLMRFRGK
jgi:hypothetical protein